MKYGKLISQSIETLTETESKDKMGKARRKEKNNLERRCKGG